ncbi:hypothetical protein AB0C34_08845 [Nocardia sp. NPDC049220]|uniref:hypothetical protein n=1 Tax=Nocardia sp. NPDC049220 TaxID=3155273 RepID=UPI0033F760BE
MAEQTEAVREPVLMTLSAPARRSVIDGLVRDIGMAGPAAPILDLDARDAEIADFLAGIAHANSGFVARTSSGASALAIIAGTAAALCGEDIRSALNNPDVAFLNALNPPAVEAVRSVLLAIETEATTQVAAALSVLTGS